MSENPVSNAIQALTKLTESHDDPAIHELIALLKELGGDDITVGDITASQAVAIGRGARVIINQFGDNVPPALQTLIQHAFPINTAPEPPARFVQRLQEFETLLDLLLSESPDAPVALTTALRGAGGYGKTTLATALCHDERVQDAFPDGILWITLGQEPNPVGDAVKVLRALTGERPALVDPEDAAQELARALGDKRCLLVLDDVWNEGHTRPFLRGGPRCMRLINTRNRDTLPPDARLVDVDAMQSDEALQLLSAGLDVGPDDLRPRLARLAARLGKWPLLLGLVNAALQRRVDQGQSLASALTWMERALQKRGLTAFDARDAQARDQAAALTLDVSLELLGEDERARYSELAVFPEDEEVPLQAVARLWSVTGGLDDLDTEELCGRLFDLSLLRRFDLAARTTWCATTWSGSRGSACPLCTPAC